MTDPIPALPDPKLPEISRRHRAFVEAYLLTWNASEAARQAGYRGRSNTIGNRLLTNVDIQARIAQRIEQMAMEADEILARLSEQARINIGDFFTRLEGPEVLGKPGSVWFLDMEKVRARGHLIKKIKFYKEGDVEIELHDGQAALVHLGKHAGLFKEIMEHTGKNGLPIEHEVINVTLTDRERAERVNALLDTARARRVGQSPN